MIWHDTALYGAQDGDMMYFDLDTYFPKGSGLHLQAAGL